MRYALTKLFDAYDCQATLTTEPVDFRQLNRISFHVFTTGTPQWDLHLEGSNDGYNWSVVSPVTPVTAFSTPILSIADSLAFGWIRAVFTFTGPSVGTLSVVAFMQGNKNRYTQDAVIAEDATTNPQTEPIDISSAKNLTFQILLDGTASGTLNAEISNDKETWFSILGGPQPLSAPLSTYGFGPSKISYMWLRFTYVNSAGAGNIVVNLKTNGNGRETSPPIR